MMELPVFLAVVLGAIFLRIFYRAVQLHWPESYFGATELSAYAISASPIRYVLFRFFPVFLVCLFVGVALEDAGYRGDVGALGVGAVHGLWTSGWALAQAAGWPATVRRQRIPVLLVRGFALPGVVGVALLAALSRTILAPLVPPVSEISSTLWTGLVAGIVGAYVARVSKGQPINEDELAALGRRSIPHNLWKLAGQAAMEAEADIDLVRAVMIVENLQRPVWFRRLEAVKGLVLRRGTYGIMQIQAERPIDDEESLKRAVKERLAGVSVTDPEGYVAGDALKQFSRTYNPNPNFHAMLSAAYNEVARVSEDRHITSAGEAPDYSPKIVVTRIERIGDAVRLEGTAVVHEGTLLIDICSKGEVLIRQHCQARAGAPERGHWRAYVDLAPETDEIIISEEAMEETGSSS